MTIVVGKHVAWGSGAKSFDDFEIQSHGTMNLEEKGDGGDEFVKENDKQSTSSAPSVSRKSRREPVTIIWNFKISPPKWQKSLWLYKRYLNPKSTLTFFIKKWWKLKRLKRTFCIGSAFDYLVERENLVKSFLVKGDKLKRIWLENLRRTIEWSDVSHPSHPLYPLFLLGLPFFG